VGDSTDPPERRDATRMGGVKRMPTTNAATVKTRTIADAFRHAKSGIGATRVKGRGASLSLARVIVINSHRRGFRHDDGEGDRTTDGVR
jgi:hypothetical protein